MREIQSHEQDVTASIEPLTHRNTEGALYQRLAVVEDQIAGALPLDLDHLRERASLSEQQDPGYLKEECLVYLIRHYRRMDEPHFVNALTEELLHRCARFIESQLRKLGDAATQDGYQDVVERLFGLILNLGSDQGDFLQVRFWTVLKRIVIQAFKQQLALRTNTQNTLLLSSLPGYDHDEARGNGWTGSAGGETSATVPSAESTVVQQDLICDALSRIDEPSRSAFLLRHYFGWPVQDADPNVLTISRHFGKDPRTIRNWLKEAERALAQWRGEQL